MNLTDPYRRPRGCWAPELRGRSAIVTGAGRLRGIGRQVALELARNGVNVVLTGTGRSPETFPPDERAVGWRDVDSVADEVRSLGVQALPLRVDVANEQAVEDLVAECVSSFGRLDILVNNAAVARGDDRCPVVELRAEVWDKLMAVNLRGTFLASRAAARQMLEARSGGTIVNISSIASKVTLPGSSAYASSKAAVDAFSRVMALELARHAITVNAINPGVVDTSRMDDVERGEAWDALIEQLCPQGRPSDGTDIAYVVAFLCSDMGRYITGQTINVDGGAAWR